VSPCSRGANERRLFETRTSGWQMEVSLLLGWFVFQGIVHSRNCLPCLTHVCNHCCKTLMRSHRLSPRFLRELSAFLQPMLFIDDGRGLECSRGLACFSEHFVEGALGIAELLLHRQRGLLSLRRKPLDAIAHLLALGKVGRTLLAQRHDGRLDGRLRRGRLRRGGRQERHDFAAGGALFCPKQR
jgi:hypothetical protein